MKKLIFALLLLAALSVVAVSASVPDAAGGTFTESDARHIASMEFRSGVITSDLSNVLSDGVTGPAWRIVLERPSQYWVKIAYVTMEGEVAAEKTIPSSYLV